MRVYFIQKNKHPINIIVKKLIQNNTPQFQPEANAKNQMKK